MIKNKLNFLKTTALIFLLSSSNISFAGIIPTSLFGMNETGEENWRPADLTIGNTDTEFDLIFNFGDWNSKNTFGMYLLDNNRQVESTLKIFGNNGNGTGTTLWDVNNYSVATQFGSLDYSNAFNVFGYELGFYFTEKEGNNKETYFSHKELNEGEDHFGFYTNTDPFGSFDIALYMSDFENGYKWDAYAITIDDISTGSNFGVLNQPPTSVPEPNSLFLFGAALIGISAYRRKKKNI